MFINCFDIIHFASSGQNYFNEGKPIGSFASEVAIRAIPDLSFSHIQRGEEEEEVVARPKKIRRVETPSLDLDFEVFLKLLSMAKNKDGEGFRALLSELPPQQLGVLIPEILKKLAPNKNNSFANFVYSQLIQIFPDFFDYVFEKRYDYFMVSTLALRVLINKFQEEGRLQIECQVIDNDEDDLECSYEKKVQLFFEALANQPEGKRLALILIDDTHSTPFYFEKERGFGMYLSQIAPIQRSRILMQL